MSDTPTTRTPPRAGDAATSQLVADLQQLRYWMAARQLPDDARETIYRAELALAAVADVPLTPEPPDDLHEALDDEARALFSALCDGDGQHSEALDVALITSALKRVLMWRSAAPPSASVPSSPEGCTIPHTCPECGASWK